LSPFILLGRRAEEGHADVMKEFDPKPYPSIDGFKNMQRLLALQNPRLADVNAANLMDTTFIRKLDESGFLAQLQARYGNDRREP
jgi:hypothetical protein